MDLFRTNIKDRINWKEDYKPGNVRWADAHTQSANKGVRCDNKSGYTGITKRKTGWSAKITVMSKQNYLGVYKTIKEAVAARNKYITDNSLTEYKIQEYDSISK